MTATPKPASAPTAREDAIGALAGADTYLTTVGAPHGQVRATQAVAYGLQDLGRIGDGLLDQITRIADALDALGSLAEAELPIRRSGPSTTATPTA